MLLITLIIPTIFCEDYLNSLRRLTRRGDPSVFIRAMSRARKFSANLTSDNFNVTKTYLEKCNAFKEREDYSRLNRQNYHKKRLLSDKIAHSGISWDYYCKKIHFWKCNSTVFEKNSAWAPIRRQTFLTTSHSMHIFALAISVLVTNAGNVCQPEALPRKSESNIILITWTIIRIMILLKEGPE